VPLGELERDLLREQIRIADSLHRCRAQLAEAVECLQATGIPGAGLEAAVDYCKQVSARADDAGIRLARFLRRRPRLR